MAQRRSSAYDDYEGFLEKFEAKRTTDDCITPPQVFEAVGSWACAEYGIDPDSIVRPFFPGGDYEHFDYPDGCTVLDNPPFSILTEIVRAYNARGVRYFLFAPGLTTFIRAECCAVCADCEITYDNGAVVRTNFVTNLDPARARTAPALTKAVEAAMEAIRREARRELPRYAYPDDVATCAMLNRYSKYGIDYRIMPEDCARISRLDHQADCGKAIFGGGLLLSRRAAAERAAATRWHLSERERRLQDSLGS